MLLRYAGGAKGMLWASQVAPGNENGLKLRVYGTKGGIEWRAGRPELSLVHALWRADAADHAARGALRSAAGRVTRIPPGHPEGYLEAFATIYTEVAHAIRAKREGKATPADVYFPGLDEGSPAWPSSRRR